MVGGQSISLKKLRQPLAVRREHHAFLPRFAQDPVQPPLAPLGQQAARIPAADIDHVLLEHEALQVGRGQVEQREV